MEEYTHKEIAEILGISEGTSKSNLSKAKMNLQRTLKEKFEKIEDIRIRMKKNIENSIKDSLNDLELPYNSNAWDSLSAKLDAGAAPSGDSGSPVDNAIKSSLENYELPYAASGLDCNER